MSIRVALASLWRNIRQVWDSTLTLQRRLRAFSKMSIYIKYYGYLELSTSSAKAPNKNSWVVLKAKQIFCDFFFNIKKKNKTQYPSSAGLWLLHIIYGELRLALFSMIHSICFNTSDIFLWYQVLRFLCNSFEVGLEMGPGHLHHPSQKTDMVGHSKFK